MSPRRPRPIRKLRVLVLMHEDLVPPPAERVAQMTPDQVAPFKTEYDVVRGLTSLGHDVRPLGLYSDLGKIKDAVEEYRPHIAFNLMEEFHGVAVYDQHVVSYLELLKKPYTGCNPRGLTMARDKSLSKKILAYHRLPVPEFAVFPMNNRRAARPRRLAFPLLVKSLTEEGSVGIGQASIVRSDEQLRDRVAFIHDKLRTDAIAEQYIEGRELYVGVMGNGKLTTLPIWEMRFTKMPEDSARIATAKVKWDRKYQEKVGIETGVARDLPNGLGDKIPRLCKRIYRALCLSGYARMDLRLTGDGKVYVIEANPNPQVAHREDFADSAEAAGLRYEALLQRIVTLGLGYRAAWQQE